MTDETLKPVKVGGTTHYLEEDGRWSYKFRGQKWFPPRLLTPFLNRIAELENTRPEPEARPMAQVEYESMERAFRNSISIVDESEAQEPVAWQCSTECDGKAFDFITTSKTEAEAVRGDSWTVVPLFTAPPDDEARRLLAATVKTTFTDEGMCILCEQFLDTTGHRDDCPNVANEACLAQTDKQEE